MTMADSRLHDQTVGRIAELEAQLKAANARADAAERCAEREAEMRHRYEAEAARLRKACKNLVDAVARARKSDDAVARNAGITADWDEHEDAHAGLIIFENAARALLSAAALQDAPENEGA